MPNKVLNNDGSMQKSFRSLYQNQKVIIYPQRAIILYLFICSWLCVMSRIGNVTNKVIWVPQTSLYPLLLCGSPFFFSSFLFSFRSKQIRVDGYPSNSVFLLIGISSFPPSPSACSQAVTWPLGFFTLQYTWKLKLSSLLSWIEAPLSSCCSDLLFVGGSQSGD